MSARRARRYPPTRFVKPERSATSGRGDSPLPLGLSYSIAAWYAAYFAVLGVLFPYWPLYLESLGFDRDQIGSLFALLIVSSVVMPFGWAWIADHGAHHMRVIRACTVAAALCMAVATQASTFTMMALAMGSFGVFWCAVLPQFEANTFAHLGARAPSYPSLRVWGSIGFIAVVVGVGAVVTETTAGLVPWLVVSGVGLLALLSQTVTAAPEQPTHGTAQGRRVVNRQVVVLLIVVFVGVASHQPYYTFYSLVLSDYGYPRAAIGVFWAIGVVSEVVVFMLLGRHAIRATRGWLLLGLAAASVRWLLLASGAANPLLLAIAQLLHAGSFALFFGGAIQLVNEAFPACWRGRGQALLSSAGHGAGGAFGAWAAGQVIDAAGPQVLFVVAAAGSASAAIVAIVGLPARHAGEPVVSLP